MWSQSTIRTRCCSNRYSCRLAYTKHISGKLSHQYLTNVQSWNIRFGRQTIHPTQKFASMNLLQMPCVITWAWSFLTSEVVEAVRGQKHHRYLDAYFGTLTQRSVHPTAPVLLTKDSRNELWLSASIQPPFSLHISNSRTKPAGLDF